MFQTNVEQYYYHGGVNQTWTFKPCIYTISYNANGGSDVPASQNKNHGQALTLSSTTPVRSGYTFLGWATSEDASEAEYQPGESYTRDESVTLYAVWKKNVTLSAPTGLTNSYSASSGKPIVKWTAVSGATKYDVYRATSESGAYTLKGTATTNSYTDTSATVGKTYYYKVKAYSSTGTAYASAFSAAVSAKAKK